jgi:lipid-A-disaccharide synthase
MKYYIIAGEASGDLHGSNLMREINKLDLLSEYRFWGGDLMKAVGGKMVKHYRDLAFMGFIEVIKNLPAIMKNLRKCKEDILQFKPDVLVLIDYPGFNLRIAKWAKKEGIKVVYYISPQVWAWKEKRVELIREVVEKMLVILPFEKIFYKNRSYDVEYVGHPLVQVIDDFLKENPSNIRSEKKIIAILPGSRKQEIEMKLPIMLEAAKHFPQYQFIVGMASSIDEKLYQNLLKDHPSVRTVFNKTYELLSVSVAALVTSGTATLETALFGVPQVVCYKGSMISYAIAKLLIKIKFISLVNLIMDKPVVTELVQEQLTVENLKSELDQVLHNKDRLAQINRDYIELKKLLEQGGHASQNAAKSVVEVGHQAKMS